MPSRRPCAAFEPISPDLDIEGLIDSTPNFERVVRIQADLIDTQTLDTFERLILMHVIIGGKPLVVEGYDRRLDTSIFSVKWLRDNVGSKVEYPRDLTKKTSVPMTFAHYLNNMALLTNQLTRLNYKDADRQRIYLKDIDCPPLWQEKLQSLLPQFLFYLNNSTAAADSSQTQAHATAQALVGDEKQGPGIAKAGDLMSCLPVEMRAENLMCYIGHEGTYTPAHREMCASLGQNIMVEASTGGDEDGKPTKPGSSLWFMTESKERQVVSEYWLSRLGHDIEVENHFAQINAWKNAPFKTYVVVQRPGDFILIPPLAPHQVWNRGTRTMKVAWNRTTVETLEMALNEALPRARMVCRDEQYKNKAIIYYALQQYSRLLIEQQQQQRPADVKVRQLQKDFCRLHTMFTQILLSESFLPDQEEKRQLIPFEGYITCSYCRCNIFNRFLTCPSCIKSCDQGEGEDDDDTYDICLDCYAMGRSCACISRLKWVEQFPWSELVQKHEQWRRQILECEPGQAVDKVPMPLNVELQRMGRKRTLAQICQLELKRRPWRNVSKALSPPEHDPKPEEEIELDINGNVKRKRKPRRSEKFEREHAPCHVDKTREPKWKQAHCWKCDKRYCYGSLFRAYDMMPQDILADPDWKCPSCLRICGCRACSKRPGYKQYSPQGTVLGHNTKAIADPRSVESLVDFGYSNLAWIQKAGDDTAEDTRRLKKRRQEADAAKAVEPALDENYPHQAEPDNTSNASTNTNRDNTNNDNNMVEVTGLSSTVAENPTIPIDPALMMDSQAASEGYEENPEGRRESPRAFEYVVPVPEGGILRDRNHAYEQTEAITYDYPDPDLAGNLPLGEEQKEKPVQRSQRNSKPVSNGNGSSSAPSQPAQILMTDRKRKRTASTTTSTHKLDQRRSSTSTSKKGPVPAPGPGKGLESSAKTITGISSSSSLNNSINSKKRKSMVVKLSIASQKLRKVASRSSRPDQRSPSPKKTAATAALLATATATKRVEQRSLADRSARQTASTGGSCSSSAHAESDHSFSDSSDSSSAEQIRLSSSLSSKPTRPFQPVLSKSTVPQSLSGPGPKARNHHHHHDQTNANANNTATTAMTAMTKTKTNANANTNDSDNNNENDDSTDNEMSTITVSVHGPRPAGGQAQTLEEGKKETGVNAKNVQQVQGGKRAAPTSAGAAGAAQTQTLSPIQTQTQTQTHHEMSSSDIINDDSNNNNNNNNSFTSFNGFDDSFDGFDSFDNNYNNSNNSETEILNGIAMQSDPESLFVSQGSISNSSPWWQVG